MAKVKDGYKVKNCNVLYYDSTAKYVDIDFQGYGIRITDVQKCNENHIMVKYKGTIGSPDFVCKV